MAVVSIAGVVMLLAFSVFAVAAWDDEEEYANPNPHSTPVPVPSPTYTAIPMPIPTHTPWPTATNTPVPPATATNTPVPPATATNTPVPPATATNTPVPPATATNTPRPPATATNTPRPPATRDLNNRVGPPALRITVLSDTRVELRWDAPDDNAVAYSVKWQPVSGGTQVQSGLLYETTLPVTGLEACTEYRFYIQAVGIGYDPSLAPGLHGYTLWGYKDKETKCYAEAIDPGGRPSECELGTTDIDTDTDTVTRRDETGAVHTVTSTINLSTISPFFVALTQIGLWDYCADASVSTISDPGADGISWSGNVYLTTYSPNAEDLANLDNYDTFAELYDALPDPPQPAANALVYSSVPPHTCSSPCEGGRTQSSYSYVESEYVKVVGLHLYGEHEITQDALSRPIELSTKAKIDRVPRRTGALSDIAGAMALLVSPSAATAFSTWINSLD